MRIGLVWKEGLLVEHFFTYEHFHALFGLSEDYVFFLKQVEDSYEYVYLNHPTKDVFNQSPIGKRMDECLSPEHAKPILESYDKAVKERIVVTYRDFYLFSDHERMNETTVTPVFKGEDAYILAITKEVSRQKEIEEKYLFFQSLLTVSIDPTVVVRKDGTIFDMNNRFEEIFGLQVDLYKGTPYINLPIHSLHDVDNVQSNFQLALEGQGRSSILNKRIKADGQIGTFLTSFSPIKNEEEVIAIFILFQEITEEMRLKEDLKATLNILEGYKKGISTAAIVTITDRDGKIQHVNDLYIETSQFSENEVLNTYHKIFDDNHSYPYHHNVMDKVYAGDIWSGELKHRKKDGQSYWVDATVIPLNDGDEEIEKFLIIEFDITGKKKVLSELRNIEKTFNLITENTNDLIAITDEYGFVLYTSPSHEKRLGLEKEEKLGTFYTDLLSEESRRKWLDDSIQKISAGESVMGEFELICKNGDSLWTETFITPVKDTESSQVYQHVIMSREITERKKLEENLRYMAYHDGLTNLPNRSFLLKEFPVIAEKAKLEPHSVAVLYLDGDNFKLVNDTFGHEVGDEFIRQFGLALKRSIRTEDLVSRLGGDEFVILLTGLPINPADRERDTMVIVERIKRNLIEGWAIGGIDFSPTSSIGVSFYPEHGSSLDELLDKADQSLYEAKKYGKDQFCIYCKPQSQRV